MSYSFLQLQSRWGGEILSSSLRSTGLVPRSCCQSIHATSLDRFRQRPPLRDRGYSSRRASFFRAGLRCGCQFPALRPSHQRSPVARLRWPQPPALDAGSRAACRGDGSLLQRARLVRSTPGSHAQLPVLSPSDGMFAGRRRGFFHEPLRASFSNRNRLQLPHVFPYHSAAEVPRQRTPNKSAAENCSGAAARVTLAAPRRPTAQPARHAPPPLRSL